MQSELGEILLSAPHKQAAPCDNDATMDGGPVTMAYPENRTVRYLGSEWNEEKFGIDISALTRLGPGKGWALPDRRNHYDGRV